MPTAPFTLSAALPTGLLVHRLSEERSAVDTEAAWIEASRNGDTNAFAELVRRHERRVFRLAGRFFDPAEVEDVAQDTFLTVWQKLDTYAAKAPFEHWLTRICLNLCYARLRSKRPLGGGRDADPLDEGLPTAEPATTPGDRALDAKLDATRLLDRLPPADRFLLQLLHGEGWSVAEIAERTGWSRSNVKVRAFRARRRLRNLIEEEAA